MFPMCISVQGRTRNNHEQLKVIIKEMWSN